MRVLPSEPEMRALHREGRMSGHIYSTSAALSSTAATAQVRGASDTLVALGKKAMSMLVLDVTVNECDHSPAHTSVPISCGVQLPDTLNMFLVCFASCSLLHKWQRKCFLDNFVTPNLIKFILSHAHAYTLKDICPEALKPNSALLVEETQQEVVQNACALADLF